MTKTLMTLKNDISRNIMTIVTTLLLVYAGFNLLFGNNSIFALHALKQREVQSQADLAQLKAQRAQAEDRVMRMRPGSLDWDLVEQEATRQLGPKPGAVAHKM